MDKIDSNVLHILITANVDGNVVKLTCGQTPLYNDVNEVLTRLGGKWQRSKGGHEFPYNPESLLTGVIGSGLMPPKNPLAFFPTPPRGCG